MRITVARDNQQNGNHNRHDRDPTTRHNKNCRYKHDPERNAECVNYKFNF